MKKITLCVIFGGASSEHEVSLVSASAIINAADPELFNIIKLGITREGAAKLYFGDVGAIADGRWVEDRENLREAAFAMSEGRRGIYVFEDDGHYFCPIDVVFPAVHGKTCEDGVLAGALELSGIPFVGCRTAAGAVCMDKDLTKALLSDADIPLAAWKTLCGDELAAVLAGGAAADALLAEIEAALGDYPLFVKPCGSGSSVGASKARDREGLREAIALAAKEDGKVMIEEYVDGREVETAVLERAGGELFVPLPGEIEPCAEFYDYDTKYKNDTARAFIPARIPNESIALVREYAAKIFRLLGCRGLSRVDFFVRHADGAVIFNEINTLPGFTPISMYPKMMEQGGLDMRALVTELASAALA